MELDNVVPIDAETARLLARRRVHFRWFVALLAAAYVGVLVPILLLTPLPPLGPFVMLAVLVVLAEHRFVLFGDETSMSASIIVVVASVFVFADSSPLAGPLLIGSLGGLYLPHLRRGSLSLMSANASSLGLSAALAGAIATGTVCSGPLGSILGVSATVAAYWYTNSVLIGSASAVRQGTLLSSSVRTQATSEWPLLMLTTASAIAVLAHAPETSSELVAVTIALVAFEIRLRHEQSAGGFSRDGSWRVATVIGFAAAIAPTGIPGVGVALLGLFLIVSNGRLRRNSTIASLLSVLAAFLAAFAAEKLEAGMGIAFVVATLVALATATGFRTMREARRLGVHLPPLVTAGLLAPSRSEAVVVSVTAIAIAVVSRLPASGPQALILAAIAFTLASARTTRWALGRARTGISGRRNSQVVSH